jgi:hypothetical protein
VLEAFTKSTLYDGGSRDMAAVDTALPAVIFALVDLKRRRIGECTANGSIKIFRIVCETNF